MTDRTYRYETIGGKEVLAVELPDGIGMVRIRTGERDTRTGYPRIAVEVVSDTLDTPATDGRFYESVYDSMQETIYLVGRPGEEG
jgi:hypothetical protein